MASLLETIRAQDGPIYGVFDAARSKDVYAELVRSKQVFHSLYEGAEAARYIDIAPYVVALDLDDAGIETLLERAQGESWAIFVTSQAPIEDVRHHLRKFVKVELDGHKNAVFFRFYDPRVFRDVIPRFDADQLQRFFESVDDYLCESEDGIDRYSFDGEALAIVPALKEGS